MAPSPDFESSDKPAKDSTATPGSQEFLLFRHMPPELRTKVWRESWEPRIVTISRSMGEVHNDAKLPLFQMVHADPQSFHSSSPSLSASITAAAKRVHAGATFGLTQYHTAFDKRYSGNDIIALKQSLIASSTRTTAKFPISLQVNRESRGETMFYYAKCFELPGGESRVYFNFGLDTLRIPRRGNLSVMLQQRDLDRLQSICIPESLPPFVGPMQRWKAKVTQAHPNSTEPPESITKSILPANMSTRLPRIKNIMLDNYYTCRTYRAPDGTGRFLRDHYTIGYALMLLAAIINSGIYHKEKHWFDDDVEHIGHSTRVDASLFAAMDGVKSPAFQQGTHEFPHGAGGELGNLRSVVVKGWFVVDDDDEEKSNNVLRNQTVDSMAGNLWLATLPPDDSMELCYEI